MLLREDGSYEMVQYNKLIDAIEIFKKAVGGDPFTFISTKPYVVLATEAAVINGMVENMAILRLGSLLGVQHRRVAGPVLITKIIQEQDCDGLETSDVDSFKILLGTSFFFFIFVTHTDSFFFTSQIRNIGSLKNQLLKPPFYQSTAKKSISRFLSRLRFFTSSRGHKICRLWRSHRSTSNRWRISSEMHRGPIEYRFWCE